jgi:uncharacterized protein YoxC
MEIIILVSAWVIAIPLWIIVIELRKNKEK